MVRDRVGWADQRRGGRRGGEDHDGRVAGERLRHPGGRGGDHRPRYRPLPARGGRAPYRREEKRSREEQEVSQISRSASEICTKKQTAPCREKHRRDSKPTNARVIHTDDDLMIVRPACSLMRF